jgi:hypothetical protein
LLARETPQTHPLRPCQPEILHIERRLGQRESMPLVLLIDTPIEAGYFSTGRILTYVLKQLLTRCKTQTIPKEKRPYDSDQAHI